MHRHLPSLLALSFVALSGAALSQQVTTPLPHLVMESHRQYAHGIFPRHANWLGLHCEQLDCEIRPTPVEVASAGVMDLSNEVQALDVLAVTGEPVAVFPGASFATGKVATWYRAEARSDLPQTLKLQKLGKWQMPWGDRPMTLSWVQTPEGTKRYHVSDGTMRQFLFSTPTEGHQGGDATPLVHWVGDLDGDGKLDLLVNLPDDSCGYDERLYLSSGTEEGKLLRKAAQLTGGEVACGC